MTRSRLTLMALVGVTALVVVGLLQIAGGSPARDGARPAAAPAASSEELPPLKRRPQVVEALRPGEEAPPDAVTGSGKQRSRPPSDAEVRKELSLFRKELRGLGVKTGARAKVLANGEAVAPAGAPAVVQQVIAAGNAIALTPYKWGGGHGAWEDNGYDCSGSVSFALAGAGLLDSPLDSTGLSRYGDAGAGRWITIFANGGHVFMSVAGLRFDTSGANGGTRWQASGRSNGGFALRHPPGL
jgi:cell wall-associated NlpC family hydrolase